MSERLSVIKTYKLYVNGGFPRSESGRSLPVHDQSGAVIAQVCHGSRKDVRDAVEAAAAAQPKWAGATAYNRGQVLYRMAEMLEGKRQEFAAVLRETSQAHPSDKKTQRSKARSAARSTARSTARSVRLRRMSAAEALREVDAAIDRLVCFGGWADKYAQVLGCNNPVAGPYYNFTVPEPTGVVGVVMPTTHSAPALLGLITLLAPPLCAGNTVVVIAGDRAMLPAAVFGEVCATSDVPAGAVNIITGQTNELIEHLAQHRNVNAISAAGISREEAQTLRRGMAENIKRVHINTRLDRDAWFDDEVCQSPWMIEPFVEMKTIWHPASA